MMRIHHWDFALTDRGRVILELNDLGSTIGSQLSGRGMLPAGIRAFMRKYAAPSAQSWVEAL